MRRSQIVAATFPSGSSPAFLFVLAMAALVGVVPLAAGEFGETDFPNSGTEAAQESFRRGLLMLHSFEYDDARAEFQVAQELDPDFAMAYWGEAMTHNHPIWQGVELAAGRAALAKLAPTAEERQAKAPTAREKAYLAALEILFGDDEKRYRDNSYAAAMERLASRFPADLDARAFHALALLGTCHDGRDIPTYMRAAAIVEEVFDANPSHPGAAHYLIHAYDDPVHAPLGIRPARVYAKVAPAAAHALHMPSHIFLALGMWDETASSNADSFRAAAERRERLGLGVDAHNYHARLWLHYALLQQARFNDALEQLADMAADAAESGSVRARRHLVYMLAAHAVETGSTDGLPSAPDLAGLSVGSAGNYYYARAHLSRLADEPEEIDRALADLEAFIENHGGGYGADAAQVARHQVAGIAAWSRERLDEALEHFERAVETEAAMPFGFGPPSPVKPAGELLGELLLELDRHGDARVAFENALARTPRRALALRGLERAGSEATSRVAP